VNDVVPLLPFKMLEVGPFDACDVGVEKIKNKKILSSVSVLIVA
jgi:hypothetical protein